MGLLKRLLSFVLAITITSTSLCTSLRKVEASQITDESYEIMETQEKTPLKSDYYKEGETVAELPATTLVYVTKSITNSHGNKWYVVNYFGEKKYCYSDYLQKHVHDFQYKAIDEEEANVCACGAVKKSGAERMFAPALAVPYVLPYVALAVFAIAVYQKNTSINPMPNLVHSAAERLETVGKYGIRYVSEHDMWIPILINTAGAVVSVSVEEFKTRYENDKKYSKEKEYFPAMIVADANGSDSVMIPDFSRAMTEDEACDYIDKLMLSSEAFGNYWEFAAEVDLCNVYTVDKEAAERLCQKIVQCSHNNIKTYGRSRVTTGNLKSERNANWCIAGSYEHFHLHSAFSNDSRACPHVLFGSMLTKLDRVPKV